MSGNTAIDIQKRDRLIVLVGLAIVVVLSWAYTIYLAVDMRNMDMMMMPHMQTWRAVDFLLMFIMWWVMMIAMMTPSASPMVLMFTTINRRREERGQPYVSTAIFLLGYLIVWGMFSVLAALAQWVLQSVALVSPMMESTSPILGGILMIPAGIFQWTPIKNACLAQCRSPMGFLMTEWRAGSRGALVMGLRHGLYCTVCCWVLMALLFVFGVMNLVWVAVLAAFVLIEKVAPSDQWISRVSGAIFVIWGIAIFFTLV